MQLRKNKMGINQEVNSSSTRKSNSEAINAPRYLAALMQQTSQCNQLNMLSATMQYYCPGGPGAAGYSKNPCRSTMSYYTAIGEPAGPLPSPTVPPTYISATPPVNSPLSSLYTASRPQYLQHSSLTAAPKVSQSSTEAAAALTMIALSQDQQVGTAAVEASPTSNECEVLSPGNIKMEPSPVSTLTPPPPTANEPDSSTSSSSMCAVSANNSNDQVYSTSQDTPGVSMTPDHMSAASSPDYTHSVHSFPNTPPVQGHITTTLQFEPFGSTYSHAQTGLRTPYTHAATPSYIQPATGYATIRYPPPSAVHISSLPAPTYGFPHIQNRPQEPFPRNNSCHICGKTYARQSTLKTHLRSHSGEKPYQCSICQKSFTQAANLTAHLRTHSGEKPFKCPICNRGFSQSSSVTTHMRTHSGDRPYKCNVCGKGFADSSTLTKHYRTHTGEKPYQCKVCEARFSQSGNLNRHMRTHRNHFQPVLGTIG